MLSITVANYNGKYFYHKWSSKEEFVKEVDDNKFFSILNEPFTVVVTSDHDLDQWLASKKKILTVGDVYKKCKREIKKANKTMI